MEFSPGGCNCGTFVPLSMSNFCLPGGVGSENQNTEGMVESIMEIQPEQFDFSSLLEGDLADDVFPGFKERFRALCLRSSGNVVSEMVKKVRANKNIRVQAAPPPPPPPPPPAPPQRPQRRIELRTTVSGSLRWTKELHAIFVDAVKQLGGAFSATPRTVWDLMNIEALALHHVKSHLQQYRTGKRIYNECRRFYIRGSSFSRAFAARSNPAPSLQQPRAANLSLNSANSQRKRNAKPDEQENGSPQKKIQRFPKHLQLILEAQIQYAEFAASRTAGIQTMGGYPFAYNQNMGGYPFAAYPNIGGPAFAYNQNMGGYPFAAYPNIGGLAFALNEKMGGYALAGMGTYPANGFIGGATMTPMQSFYPYQPNRYNGCTSGAGMHAWTFPNQKPDELQSIPVAYPHQLTQASFPATAPSGSHQQGFNYDAGESSGIAEMSDEEFVESFLIDCDELVGDS